MIQFSTIQVYIASYKHFLSELYDFVPYFSKFSIFYLV